MKSIAKHISTVVSMLALAGVLLGVVYLFQPPTNGVPLTRATEMPASGYPAPNTPITPTQLATLMAYVTQEVITIQDLTPLWFTPEPTLTATPSLGGSVIYDPVNKFSLTLPAGWYAYPPDPNAIVGVTQITNYDLSASDKRPALGVSAQISVGPLEDGKTFDQWIAERRQLETSPDYGAGNIQLTDAQQYTLAKYAGVRYTARELLGETTMVIYLLTDDRQIIGISIRPTESPNFAKILTILETLTLGHESQP